ncbi:putative methyltransferase NSUN6, partial [Copidosoma floridanum]|uniref:putative methyltransferase NSUN6 n=1 Tax=Copidosoma floridanum TaxID=29053 RepID=UPI000C6F5A64
YMSVTMGDNLNNFHTVQLKDEILKELKNDLKRIKVDDNYIDENNAQDKLEQLISWMSSTPKNIVIRVNTILCEPSTVHHKINEFLKQYSRPLPNIKTFPHVEELIVINSWEGNRGSKLTTVANELIVDAACGVAVLRGAHIFAPGVLGMPRGLKIGDKVSVYADLKKNCKKGLVINYDINSKLFIGNGIVNLTRDQIFANYEKSPSGIAVFMSDTISHVPQLNEEILPKGQILLQNLPSVICSRVLNPQPRDIILDMCAAPGNKTTHISALMKNE